MLQAWDLLARGFWDLRPQLWALLENWLLEAGGLESWMLQPGICWTECFGS